MKKINKFLALSFLLCAGSMHVVKAEEDRTGQHINVESDNKDGEVLCRSILTYDIATLKVFIAHGNVVSVVKLLIPEMKINEKFKQYLLSSTFLHLLMKEIDPSVLDNLKSAFSQIEIDAYRSKLVELMRYAIEIGVDINAENIDGETVLDIAVESGIVDMVELLIQSGANVNRQDKNGYLALHRLVIDQIETLYIVTFITTIDSSCSLLSDEELLAHVKAREAIIKILINNDADLSIKDSKGETVIDYINYYIKDVNEAFDYYESDEISCISLCGYHIVIDDKKDYHNYLIILKNKLEALQQLLQK